MLHGGAGLLAAGLAGQLLEPHEGPHGWRSGCREQCQGCTLSLGAQTASSGRNLSAGLGLRLVDALLLQGFREQFLLPWRAGRGPRCSEGGCAPHGDSRDPRWGTEDKAPRQSLLWMSAGPPGSARGHRGLERRVTKRVSSTSHSCCPGQSWGFSRLAELCKRPKCRSSLSLRTQMALLRVEVRAWGLEGPAVEPWNPGTTGSDPPGVHLGEVGR